jgi:hypothetical protein
MCWVPYNRKDFSRMCWAPYNRQYISRICWALHNRQDISRMCWTPYKQDISRMCWTSYKRQDISRMCWAPCNRADIGRICRTSYDRQEISRMWGYLYSTRDAISRMCWQDAFQLHVADKKKEKNMYLYWIKTKEQENSIIDCRRNGLYSMSSFENTIIAPEFATPPDCTEMNFLNGIFSLG